MNKSKPENKFEIPVAGSLGLLALGYRGVLMWRKVRDEAQVQQKTETKKP